MGPAGAVPPASPAAAALEVEVGGGVQVVVTSHVKEMRSPPPPRRAGCTQEGRGPRERHYLQPHPT